MGKEAALERDSLVSNSLPRPPSVEHSSSVAEIGDAAEQSGSASHLVNIDPSDHHRKSKSSLLG